MKANIPSHTDALDYLKGVTSAKLPALAEEVNHLVYANVLSNQERHPGPGSVPLSIALQRVFDPRNHKILWEENVVESFRMILFNREFRFDPGHVPAFSNNERSDSHSPDDEFCLPVRQGIGLSSTFGLLHARKKLKGDYWVVAILEMQQFLEGFSTEILDQLRDIEDRFLLVLYDSGVSRKREDDSSQCERHPLEDRLLDAWLNDFGLDYGDPVNANHLEQLDAKLEAIRTRNVPAILRVKAAESPENKNGASNTTNRIPGTPQKKNGKKVFSPCLKVLDVELTALARNNSRILMVSPPLNSPPLKFFREFPEQYSGVARIEESVLSWCAGAASGGCHPFVLMTKTSLLRNIEQLATVICPAKTTVTFLIGKESILQGSRVAETKDVHGSLFSCLRLLPQMVVAAPKDNAELRDMLKLAQKFERPLTVLLPDDSRAAVADSAPSHSVPWGEAEVLFSGSHDDVVLLGIGESVSPAMIAARQLVAEGISVSVVNARFAVPLDISTIQKSCRNARQLLVLESPFQRGFGSLVTDSLAEGHSPAPVRVLEINTDSSLPSNLESQETDQRIVRSVRKLMRQSTFSGQPVNGHARKIGSHRQVVLPEQADRIEFSDESALRERALTQAKTLSPLIDEWVERYEEIGERTRYLWQWCLHGLELITFSCVHPKWRAHVCDTKLLAVILGVLFDDVADQQKDPLYLEELLRIADPRCSNNFSQRSPQQQKYARFACELWDVYQERLRAYPCYDVYSELLDYDHQQIFNAMRYSQLVNGNLLLLNLVEHDLYLPHNMQMMSFASIDLMCSPDFDARELGKLREAMWHAQCMGRIGNLVSTWQREIGDKDFSSGVFARSVMVGDLSLEELGRLDAEDIETAIHNGGHETHFLNCWRNHYNRIKSLQPQVQSLDLGKLLMSLERLIHMELGSRGLK